MKVGKEIQRRMADLNAALSHVSTEVKDKRNVPEEKVAAEASDEKSQQCNYQHEDV